MTPTPQYLGGPCDGRLVATDAPDAQTLHPVLTMGNITVALTNAYMYERAAFIEAFAAGTEVKRKQSEQERADALLRSWHLENGMIP